ncbi:unnamed protein product, partial [Rotaria sordida]
MNNTLQSLKGSYTKHSKMEIETMLQEDGETITRTIAKNRQSGKRKNKWKSNLLRLGVGALAIMFLAKPEEETIPKAIKIQVKQAVMPYIEPRQMDRNMPRTMDTPYWISPNSRCALCINRIGLVQMPGEYGTSIQDGMRTSALSNDDRYRQHMSATA